ncbi:DNA polymerase III, alpha subunit [Actinomyces ruminicola]|uniref:DNA polymerase III subunit alpha n=1 Tax=Actinomyces ruminicola TaxID=332524 RepID=A0A1G9Z8C1_9ACTO|nr:DNA polymerase III subunit alpha [Actinomyces ruminicola]SDN17584.1 DNA polymerase III, alpha subunit [Actinomyces ruminicola]
MAEANAVQAAGEQTDGKEPYDDFVHLHVHTDYSMLDGAGKIKDYVAEAKRLGQRALAITDHGYMFGAYEFYAAAKKAGIKPIIGVEAYLTPGTSRFDKTRVFWGDESQRSDDVSARGSYTHMTLLSHNDEGLHNLMRLDSFASLEGQWGKAPRMDRELISRYSKGLISSTGCPSSEVQTRLRLGQWDEALRAAGELQDIFGKDYFYVELMDHGLEIERRVTKDLLRLAKTINAPLLATNDSHYVRPEDRTIQDAMLCINSGSVLSDPDRFKFDGDTYYLRPGREMRALFKEMPEACDNTLLVAEQCNVSFQTVDDGASFMPVFPVPEGETMESWFISECWKGMDRRFHGDIPEECRKQAEYEIGVIVQMGFPGYFLVVADYINWAKRQGIRVGPGRGSGAGSMVAYAMGITELNPLNHGLIFERFLNPERISMPDIDVDFDERRRDEVIEYVKQKYGSDRVSQVVTYGVIKAKQSLKDSSRVMGYPYAVGDRLTKAMPPAIMGKDITIKGMFNPEDPRYGEAQQFRDLHAEDPDAQKIVELASGLEGMTRQWGVHACAVIMSSHTLTDIIPMMQRLQDGAFITQFDYPTCEHLGLLKMDFLGLRNLTVISDALDNIVANGKEPLDIDHIELDDRATYELLARGETLGVFQLDGGGMRTLLRLMKPDNFEDISAVGALYRPGPMGAESHTNYALRKNGLQEIIPIHPELKEALEPILGTTYGLIVYQEQVMKIATDLAGFTMGKADALRKAMGKKKMDILEKMFVEFEAGMVERGFSKESVKALWDVVVPFAKYAFNKAHSAAYGVVSYWTAYLKAHYPTEYMAALLTSQKDNKDKLGVYLGECRHMGIKVLPPDVNASRAQFSAVGDDVRFGLGAIRNVGANVVDAIVKAREQKGDFTSFEDFLDKVPAVVCNKRTIDSLIKAGAFDTLGKSRRALQACHEDFVDEIIGVKRNEAAGQFDLFASIMGDAAGEADAGFGSGPVFSSEVPDLPEWDKKEKLAYERDMLGLYVSDHPLLGLESALAKLADTEISDLIEDDDRPDGAMVTIAGLITSLTRKTTKQGNLWAIAQIEDLGGSIEALFFPSTYQTVSTMLAPDTVVTLRGRLNRRDGQVALYVQEMTVPDVSSATHEAVTITLPTNRCTGPLVEQFKTVLEKHPGMSTVRLTLTSPGREVRTQLDNSLRVEASAAFYSDIKALLGPGCLKR